MECKKELKVIVHNPVTEEKASKKIRDICELLKNMET